MCNEEAKNVRRTGRFLVVVGMVVVVWFGVSLVFPSAMGTADTKPKRKPTRLSLAQVLGKSNRERSIANFTVQARFKQIKGQAKQKAVEHQAWVKDIATKVNSQSGGGNATSEYVPGTDPQIDMMQLEHDMNSWIIQEVEKMKQEIDARVAKQGMIDRINNYLSRRKSPMSGLGSVFVDEAAEYGIDPRLSVAISEGESTCGLACFAPHNAWGMLAYRGFSSWEEGIHMNIEWLHKYYGSPQSAYDCGGYCEPDHPWMENVDGVRQSI